MTQEPRHGKQAASIGAHDLANFLYRRFELAAASRAKAHARSNSLPPFRDRIAHHEPLFHEPSKVTHAEDIEAIGWMCRHTAA